MPLLHFTAAHADWLFLTLAEKVRRQGKNAGSTNFRIRRATPEEINEAGISAEIPDGASLFAVVGPPKEPSWSAAMKFVFLFAADHREKITIDMLRADAIAEEIFDACRRGKSVFLGDRRLFDSGPRPEDPKPRPKLHLVQ